MKFLPTHAGLRTALYRGVLGIVALTALNFFPSSGTAQDWANWRGPEQNGISRNTHLVDDWSFQPRKNVKWVQETGGRSTPIILNGRLYINCRTTDDVTDPATKVHSREQVVCFDAETGKELWRDVFNVFQTDIPAPRVGWASMCGDPETGNVFMHSVDGLFRCYTPDGKIVWEHSLAEEYGKISGYGGRTQTPIIDEDRVIVSFLATNWGDQKGPAPKHYYYAFDKKTGELQWVSAPGGRPKDTNYSVPVVAVINGQRMLIGGNSDGGVYAINARTGKPIWGFHLSRRGLNASPVVDGNYVYISHGQDNVANTHFGRIQCIDATGTGDVTKTHDVWHRDKIKAGYTGLLVHDGILYVMSDEGNLHAFDSHNGQSLWVADLGIEGKGSPVWADGKIYITEVNGRIWILKPSRKKCETVCSVVLPALDGSGPDEITASPAISEGRVYFVSRDRTICIEDAQKKVVVGKPHPLPPEAPPTSTADLIQLRPYETILKAGESIDYTVCSFDPNGRLISQSPAEHLILSDDLEGFTTSGPTLTAPTHLEKNIAGTISTRQGSLTATARVRMFNPAKVWKWDFEGYHGVQVPTGWIRAHIKIKPALVEGNTVMKVSGGMQARGRPSHQITLGPPGMKNFEIQADVMMLEQKRRIASTGLSNQRYNLILRGNTGKLLIQSWAPHQRMAREINFPCEPDTWYTMKMKVETINNEAHVYGKVWKRDTPEPKEWTLEAIDPHPNESGPPGLYSYALADCYFDNVIVRQQ